MISLHTIRVFQITNTTNVFVGIGLANSWLSQFWSSVVLFGVDGFAVAVMCIAIVVMPVRMYLARRKYVALRKGVVTRAAGCCREV